MKPTRALDLVSLLAILAGLLLLAFALTGCKTPTGNRPPIDAKPTITAHEGKDRTILSEAAQIDAIAPQAKPHTDAQRAAIAAAPAADVAALVARYEAQAKADAVSKAQLQRDNARLVKDLASAHEKTDRVIRLGGYALAALLTAAGVASFFLAAQLPMLGPRIGIALVAAGASVFAMVQAYEWTKAHPWVTGITLALLLVAAVLAYANQLHARSAPLATSS